MTTTQQDAARVLVTLTGLDLPPLSWDLPHYDAKLRAQAPATVDDETKHAVMAAWAKRFLADVETRRYEGYTELEITTEVDDIPVEIFCHVDRSATYGRAGGA